MLEIFPLVIYYHRQPLHRTYEFTWSTGSISRRTHGEKALLNLPLVNTSVLIFANWDEKRSKMPIPAFNRTTAVSQWTSFNTTQAQVKGIPNFFSRSMFGNTTELKSAAQFIVVWAVVAVILRIFSRRRLKTRIGWDDICAMAAVFFLVTNQMIFSMIEFLGISF